MCSGFVFGKSADNLVIMGRVAVHCKNQQRPDQTRMMALPPTRPFQLTRFRQRAAILLLSVAEVRVFRCSCILVSMVRLDTPILRAKFRIIGSSWIWSPVKSAINSVHGTGISTTRNLFRSPANSVPSIHAGLPLDGHLLFYHS